MAAVNAISHIARGRKGGSEEHDHCAIYRYGPLAERRCVRILGLGLSVLSTFDAVPGFISVIGRERSRHFRAGLCDRLLYRAPALHAWI